MTGTHPQARVNGPPAIAAGGDIERQLRDQWLASLNHEIRTPLAGIVGLVDLLLETTLDAEQRDYVESTRECAESLLANFNAMLEYSALSAGVVHADEVEFHLGVMLHEVIGEHITAAQAKGLGVIYSDAACVGRFVTGDQERIRQIFRQILGNAVKFTHNGEIEIRADYRDNGPAGLLSVSVRDTGIGIRKNDIPKVFVCFSQVESGLARSYSGLGLGLSLAKKLAALLGGSIAVESEIGEGSVFSFEIPLKNGVETPGRRAHPGQPTKGPRRILVVEDNKISQRIVTHLLRRHEHEVDCVDSGIEAVEAFRRSHYGLVLMDLQLPGIDGLETTRRIRALPEGARVPIIALTANASDDHKDRCLTAGMHDFLSKPVQPDELISVISRHFN